MQIALSPFPWGDLIDWYEKNSRHDLEWRNYSEEDISLLLYRIWLSEILLQQTQVERVRGYYTRMLEKYPTIHHLARASYEEFFPFYQGLGYYSRARNILKTSQIISTEYGGVFPQEKSLLMKLPGVGGYTSAAILAFAFGESVLAWDTNLEKVFARYYHGRKDLKLSEKEKQIVQKDFQKWVSDSRKKSRKESVRALNNALMDFAAMIDLKNPNTIDWTHYPIKSGQFYETRGVLEPAESKRPLSFPTPDATVIVILHENHKIYYSPLKLHSSYSPCILPPALTRDTRQYVQGYFRARYRLELSVRPVHKKWISKEGQPYIAVNAQIQVGDASAFEKYEKSEAKLILDSLGEHTLHLSLVGSRDDFTSQESSSSPVMELHAIG